MAFSGSSEAPVGFQPFAVVDTIQRHVLGTRLKGNDPIYGEGEFIYLTGVAATVVGSWAKINEDNFSTTLLLTTDVGQVGVAMAANVAANFGWYQIKGKAIGRAAAAYADNALVYATAVAGVINSAVIIGSRVKGALGASTVGTPSANLAEFEINFPLVDNGAAS